VVAWVGDRWCGGLGGAEWMRQSRVTAAGCRQLNFKKRKEVEPEATPLYPLSGTGWVGRKSNQVVNSSAETVLTAIQVLVRSYQVLTNINLNFNQQRLS
jgi:hypothetical protein